MYVSPPPSSGSRWTNRTSCTRWKEGLKGTVREVVVANGAPTLKGRPPVNCCHSSSAGVFSVSPATSHRVIEGRRDFVDHLV